MRPKLARYFKLLGNAHGAVGFHHAVFLRRVVQFSKSGMAGAGVVPAVGGFLREGIGHLVDLHLQARFESRVTDIRPSYVVVEGPGGREEIPAEGVFLLTGYHPDADLMRRAGIHCDEVTLEPDLNKETYESNVPNLFIAGGAIAGKRTGNIFIENGRVHGPLIARALLQRRDFTA